MKKMTRTIDTNYVIRIKGINKNNKEDANYSYDLLNNGTSSIHFDQRKLKTNNIFLTLHLVFQIIMKPMVIFNGLKNLLAALLLPIGYPESVCPEYIRFQFWDTLQEACGYFRGILSNQAWLTVLGVGNADVTVVSAVAMTMAVDYSGMVSGLCLAGSRELVRKFAANQKFWTMTKEVLLLTSAILTIIASVFPKYMICILIAGRVMGTAAGVIGGCCQSTLVTHIARKNNFPDCNAKEGNQSRLMRLVLIGIGYRFLIFVNETGERVITAFAILSLGRLYCVYKSMKTLELRTLNINRLLCCVKAWNEGEIEGMSLARVAQKERILIPPKRSIIDRFGCKISELDNIRLLKDLILIHKDAKHILIPSGNLAHSQVLLKQGSDCKDYLKAYLHACFYHLTMTSGNIQTVSINKDVVLLKTKVKESFEKCEAEHDNFTRQLTEFDWDIVSLSLFQIEDERVEISFVEGETEKKHQ